MSLLTSALELVSIELTNVCNKGCSFCYNRSNKEGQTFFTNDILVPFIRDLAENGVKSVSLGGGEPLMYPGLMELLENISPLDLYLSMTSNGILLGEKEMEEIAPFLDKIHISIHFPESEKEVERALEKVALIEKYEVKGGVNIVVDRNKMEEARKAVNRLIGGGLIADQLIVLPLRMSGTEPTPKELANVAVSLGKKWQSQSCLLKCEISPRFCSLSWDGRLGWCSYTETRRQLEKFTYGELVGATEGLDLRYCGETPVEFEV